MIMESYMNACRKEHHDMSMALEKIGAGCNELTEPRITMFP